MRKYFNHARGENMNINILYLFFLLTMPFLGCPGGPAPKKIYAPIPEDYAWKLEEKFSDPASQHRIAIVSHYTVDKENIPFIKLATQNHIKYAKKYKYDYFFRNGTIDGTEKFRSPTANNRTFQLGLYWQKIQAMSDLLKLKNNGKHVYDYVFWIDTDAVFTNLDLSLEELIENADKDAYFFIAEDVLSRSSVPHTCVNAGVFMVKNSKEGRDLIKNVSRAFKIYEKVWVPEQAAMQDLAYGFLDPANIDKIALDENALKKFHSKIGQRQCQILWPKKGVELYLMQDINAGYPWEFERVRWNPKSLTAHFFTLDGPRTKKYMESLLDCLEHYNYKHRERCTPEKLNIALRKTVDFERN